MRAFHLFAMPCAVAFIALLASCSDASAATTRTFATDRQALPLERVVEIPLPGPARRFDYQSYDARRRLLFIAHLAAGNVVAFDTRARRIAGEITGVSAVHGVLVVPEEERVYASATGTNEIVVMDENTFQIVARAPGGVYPDGMAYAPEVHKLYVSDQAGKTETVIDTRTNRRVRTIDLGGEAGNSQYDPVSKRIFVNVQTRNELVEIDPAADAIVGRHALAGAKHNHGLLIDAPHRLAYVACEGNDSLLVMDLTSMRMLKRYPVGKDPDVLAFDEGLGLLYVASESGVLTMFKAEGKSLRELGRRFFGPHAHSVAVDNETHDVYFPLENIRGRPVLRIARPSTPGAASRN